MFHDLFYLIFPHYCAGCGADLNSAEDHLCSRCLYHLPRSYFMNDPQNPLAKTFWGRANIEQASAFLVFNKQGMAQRLVHSLKYKGNKELGVFLGRLYAADLAKDGLHSTIDMVLPVPLHKKKERRRGYNQSLYFARGLAEGIGKPCADKVLVRNSYTESQTGKTRFERWANVKEVFEVPDKAAIQNKHILLVDDVATTGATLEACASRLLVVPDTKVSIAVIAYAER